MTNGFKHTFNIACGLIGGSIASVAAFAAYMQLDGGSTNDLFSTTAAAALGFIALAMVQLRLDGPKAADGPTDIFNHAAAITGPAIIAGAFIIQALYGLGTMGGEAATATETMTSSLVALTGATLFTAGYFRFFGSEQSTEASPAINKKEAEAPSL